MLSATNKIKKSVIIYFHNSKNNIELKKIVIKLSSIFLFL